MKVMGARMHRAICAFLFFRAAKPRISKTQVRTAVMRGGNMALPKGIGLK